MKESLTNRQIAFIIFGFIVGYGVLGLPKNITESAGTGGWVSLLIATIITLLFTYILTYLSYVFDDKTIFEYSQTLVGKTITYIFMVVYSVYFFMIFTMVTRISSETIKLTILVKTPVWALSLVFFIVVYYAVIKELRVIGRICEIYGLIIIITAIIIYFLIFSQGKLVNIKPFFVMKDIPIYFKSTLSAIFPFIGFEILIIIPFNRKENNKKIFKYTTLMVSFIGLLYILVVEACVSVMGVDGIIHYKDALYATIRRVDIQSLQFLRRLDSIFLIAWIMSIFTTITLAAYGCIFILSKLLNKIKFNILAFFVIILSFLVSMVPKTTDEIQKVLDYTGYGVFLTGALIPVILLIITKVKKYDKKI